MGGTVWELIVVFSEHRKLFRDVNLIKRVAIARGPIGETSALRMDNVDKEVTNKYINDTLLELIHIE